MFLGASYAIFMAMVGIAPTVVVGGPVAPQLRAASECYQSETSVLHCYNGADDMPADVDAIDVAFIASYLRRWGRQNPTKPAFHTMLGPDTKNCDEWTLYQYGTALALIKHLNPNVNSSVLYEDIANTIDGGENATTTGKEAALIGCGSSGGSLGVLVNDTNPNYHTSSYKASNYTTAGVLIKIVHG